MFTATFIKQNETNILNKIIGDKSQTLVVGNVQSGKTRFMIETAINALKSDYDCVIVLGGSNNKLLSQTDSRFKQELDSSKYFIYNLSQDIVDKIPNQKTLITLLKGEDKLNRLEKITKYYKGKTLILDDESDFGSINQGSTKRTTINRLIFDIYNNLSKCHLFSITATPFADILSDTEFDRSLVLKPYEGYAGSEYFLNSDCYVVSDDDGDNNLSSVNYANILIDHIKRVESYLNDESIEKNNKGTQLLINNGLGNDQHIDDFKLITKSLEQLYVLMPKYEVLISELLSNIKIMNSKSEDTDIDFDKNSIVIGGQLVSRGFTFENLLTTILYNEPKDKQSADTLLQRARWFGNRKSYSKYMKIILTQKTLNSFVECNELINLVYNLLDENPNDVNFVKNKIKENKFTYINLTGKKVK